MRPDLTSGAAPPPDPAQDAGLQPSRLRHPVVAIGASAGGLAALARFFERMPADNGMSFVVVLHLPPSLPSHAAAVLQRACAMPVAQAADGAALLPNRVYVNPPGHALAVSDGRLLLSDEQRLGGARVVIDSFFRVLAQVHRRHAVGIVLSGAGSDGAAGLKRIKELGGLTLAQAPDEAEHSGMPAAAVATGIVDFVLPAAEMPAKLLQLAANAAVVELPADTPPELEARPAARDGGGRDAEAALAEIMGLLRVRTGHDFRHYKRPTVLRRLGRRMQVTALPTLPAYAEHLRQHPEETPALLQDMLVSVTHFFRDRGAFDALARDVLPGLQSRAGRQGLRAWVVGCASGEEAYSIAMLLQEAAAPAAQPAPLRVFASDIDERALAIARAGVYPGSIVADVPARLLGFFVRDGEFCHVAKALRERVLFAQHNVLRDPPFSHIDLICCRNLLIYLERDAQAAVLDVFRFALRPGGVLFLGPSESVAMAGGGRWAAVDEAQRLYRLLPDGGAGRRPPAPSLWPPQPAAPGPGGPAGVSPPTPAELHQRATLAWAPPSVLLDAQNRILHASQGARRHLERPDGLPAQDLLDAVRPELRPALRSALFCAGPGGDGTAAPASVECGEGEGRVRITVQPLRDEQADADLVLVVFEPLAQRPPPAGAADAPAPELLEEEVRELQQRLQQVVEHSEASGEELMSSNEELQAVNEELRSATEELETSREALQAANEELTGVNGRLAAKVEEAGRVTDDLENLVAANDIAAVFVDASMRVERYTPRATELFDIAPRDLGAALPDVANRLDYPGLADDARAAFRTLRVVEREVAGPGGRRFVARMLPYRSADDRIKGATLSFIDVTALRASQQEAAAGAERLRRAAQATRDFAIVTLDEQGLVTGWNLGATRLFGYDEAEAMGRDFAMVFTAEDRAAGAPQRELQQARAQGRAEDERWHRRKDGSVFYCSGVTTPLDGGGGYAKIARDLTGSRQAALARERQLSSEQAGRRRAEATMEAKELFLAMMSHELRHPLNLIHVNAELLSRIPELARVPAAARAADIIRQTVAGQARLVEDLLDLSRARAGKLTLEPQPVDWVAHARRIVDASRPDAQARGVRLQFDAGTPAPVSLFDPVRAEQVVWNLLNNALKFTPDGGSVRVAVATEGDDALLTFTDSGRGISPDFLGGVFDLFSQEGGGIARRGEEGLGIGLALVRELVQAHGGQVQARSDGPGRGAEFSVRVPLHRAPAAPAAPDAPASSLSGLRVLVVDDSADAVESFAVLLKLAGAAVDTATQGDQALQRLAAGRYDLLLSDLSMPRMSGHELIAAARALPQGRELLALACSGYTRPQDLREAQAAGFDALIVKPAALERIERAVAELTARRRAAAAGTADAADVRAGAAPA